MTGTRPLKVLTWHVHGNYLYYLSHTPHEWYLPLLPRRTNGYAGRAPGFPWGEHVHEVPAEELQALPFDCILFQSRTHFEQDRYEWLSDAQRRLPAVYLEHDPPREHPTDTRHPAADAVTLLVHVTPFNALMWDSGRTAVRVIEHGVPDVGMRYTGELDRGLVIVNMLHRRGRRLGLDVFEDVRRRIPLDLIGMEAEMLGGFGEVPHDKLADFVGQYRFVFNPIRYTSLGLAICEAMMQGSPVVGLATTEMVTAIQNGVSGCVETSVDRLVAVMRALIRDPALARRWGEGARRAALARFGMARFIDDWNQALTDAVAMHPTTPAASEVKTEV